MCGVGCECCCAMHCQPLMPVCFMWHVLPCQSCCGRYPMTVAGMGMLASSLFSYILCRVTKSVEAKAVITSKFWVSRMLPVGFFMAATLWCGNLVYLYLSVSFIQMLKAFTPVITMIALFIAQLETPTTKVHAALPALTDAMPAVAEGCCWMGVFQKVAPLGGQHSRHVDDCDRFCASALSSSMFQVCWCPLAKLVAVVWVQMCLCCCCCCWLAADD